MTRWCEWICVSFPAWRSGWNANIVEAANLVLNGILHAKTNSQRRPHHGGSWRRLAVDALARTTSHRVGFHERLLTTRLRAVPCRLQHSQETALFAVWQVVNLAAMAHLHRPCQRRPVHVACRHSLADRH